MTRFVICLDGTWNNTSREIERETGSKVYRPTNVLKTARATTLRDSTENPQITYYDAGVGAMNRAPDTGAKIVRFVDNKVGGGWGGGFEVNIEEAFTFLANNFSAGDEIFIFGFSRGAAQARSLCNLISWFGGIPTKDDAYFVPRIFTRYLESQADPDRNTIWEEANERRRGRGDPPLKPIMPANIVYLGVWDTVLALGSRLRSGGGTTRKKKQFHTPAEPPTIAQHIRHAISIDEARHDFQPEVFLENTGHPSLEQRWFAGVHSNVGGGLASDGLANCALHWIIREAVAVGLSVNDDYLKFFGKFPQGDASSKSVGFKVSDTLLRPLRGFNGVRNLGIPAGMIPDDSVFDRLNANPANHKSLKGAYRPKNLMQFLADNPVHDAKLEPAALAAVEQLRKA